jgi:hypothetical protein
VGVSIKLWEFFLKPETPDISLDSYPAEDFLLDKNKEKKEMIGELTVKPLFFGTLNSLLFAEGLCYV